MIFDDTFFGWLSFLLVLYWGIGAIVGVGFLAGVISQVGWKPFFQRPEVKPA
jgi:hypothetical protein